MSNANPSTVGKNTLFSLKADKKNSASNSGLVGKMKAARLSQLPGRCHVGLVGGSKDAFPI